jgi:hypothetical protein
VANPPRSPGYCHSGECDDPQPADKRAIVVLLLDEKAFDFWRLIFDKADEKNITQLSDGTGTLVELRRVKHFSLLDHQFIQLKLDFNKGMELQVWIPRNFVIAILESKSDLSAAFSFAGSKTK